MAVGLHFDELSKMYEIHGYVDGAPTPVGDLIGIFSTSLETFAANHLGLLSIQHR